MQSEGGKLETRVNLTHFRAPRHELRWNNDRIHPDPGLIICSTLSELMVRVIWLRVMRLFVMTFVPGIRMVTMRHWWWWGDICSPGSGCSQWPGIGSCPRCHNAATGLLSSPLLMPGSVTSDASLVIQLTTCVVWTVRTGYPLRQIEVKVARPFHKCSCLQNLITIYM